MAYFKYIKSQNNLLPNEAQEIERLIVESDFLPSKHLSQIVDKEIGFSAIVGYDRSHTPCCFAALDSEDKEELKINFLYVTENARGYGLAKKLLSYSYIVGEKLKKQRLSLMVQEDNKAARNLYEEAGFNYVFCKNGAFSIMEKTLESENNDEKE